MNKDLKIVRLNANDIDIAYEMDKEIFNDDPWPKEWFIEGITDTEGYYYFAYFKGKLAGFCGMYHISTVVPNYCKIAKLGVKSEYRNQGIGKALMQKMLDTARSLKLERAKLEVSTKNDAIRLYESFGFKISEFKENYYDKTSEDAYIMWLDHI